MGIRDDLLVKIAILYYEAQMTQTRIAEELGLSRPTIASMLKEAKEKGIVQIHIQKSTMNIPNQQKFLCEKYNLQSVIISEEFGSTALRKHSVGYLCAKFLEERMMQYNSIGLGWGTTVYEYVQAASFSAFDHLEIVPLMGGIGINDIAYHSNHLAFQLAEKYNCHVHYFYAPALAENNKVYDLFKSTQLVQEIQTKAKQTDIAIIGVGNPSESATYRRLGYITQEENEEIKNQGAIGDILGSFFDEDGNVVNTSVSNRMIGLTLEDIEMMNEVLLFGVGKEKAISFRALLKKGIADYLIIDKEIADLLIEDE